MMMAAPENGGDLLQTQSLPRWKVGVLRGPEKQIFGPTIARGLNKYLLICGTYTYITINDQGRPELCTRTLQDRVYVLVIPC
jgi:hypothetical protein